jgi:hypothetical protein
MLYLIIFSIIVSHSTYKGAVTMPTSIGQRISVGILACCLTGYVLYQSLGSYFFSRNISLRVVQNDAVEQCDSIRPRLLGGKYRTESPEMQGFGFCGVVVTDHGGFVLPEPQLIWRMGVEDRASLDKRLLDGFCYEVLVDGFGEIPKRGDALANRGLWEIVSVVDEVTCAS